MLRLPKGISRNVAWLGLVSLLTDISSEMLYPVIPLFLTATLGARPAVVGIIEGVAEMTASLMKALSGGWSDAAGRRKPFVVAGYSCSALAKGALALAGAWPGVLAARTLDRFGKGVRSTARDAMLAESAEPAHRGVAFGFHRSMDQLGAVAGPLLALPLLALFHGDYRLLFLAATIPALAGVAVLAIVRETGSGAPALHRVLTPWRDMPPLYRRYLIIYAVFALGNSADAFLLLRARQLGASPAAVITFFAWFNAVTVCCAWPAGRISDIVGRRGIVIGGLCVFAAAYGGMGAARNTAWLWTLFAFYGIYSGVAEGAAKAYLVDLAGPDRKATALGYHGAVAGGAALFASLLAGVLWERISPAAPFLVGGAGALLAALLLLLAMPRPGRAAA